MLIYSRGLAVVLFWPAVALIAWGELTPHPPDLAILHWWDKLLHFTAYFGLAGMATLALGLRRPLIFALIALIALGGTLEILQGFTGRDPDIMDAFANSLGVLAGASLGACFILLFWPRRARRGRRI